MNDLQKLTEWVGRTPVGYFEFLLRQAISEAKETLGEARTKQIVAEELER